MLIYLQTQRFQPHLSRDDHRRIRHHTKYYLILNDTLYRHGIDSTLWRCLTREDCHFGACGGHFSRMAIAQKILHAGYFWPSVFKDCHEAIKKYPPCQHFYPKMCSYPTLLHPIIVVGPFCWSRVPHLQKKLLFLADRQFWRK